MADDPFSCRLEKNRQNFLNTLLGAIFKTIFFLTECSLRERERPHNFREERVHRTDAMENDSCTEPSKKALKRGALLYLKAVLMQ